MIEPTTPTGKRLIDGQVWVGVARDLKAEVLAIEAEARQQERERLRTLYMATEAGQYCNTDVWHVHNHTRCLARCWCSWADPENCPYPVHADD